MSSLEKVDRPNTLVVKIPDELSDLSQSEVVDKLVAGLNVGDISAIQFMPRRFVRITFHSFSARNAAFLAGIAIDSMRLYTMEADPVVKDVYLEHLPVEVSDEALSEALRPFGSVLFFHDMLYPGTSIRTGTRVLKMSLASDIPVNIRILRYPCRVFYKGQPRPCSICRSPDHLAADCSLRDVCRLCHQSGHFARDCTLVLNAAAPPNADDDDVSSDNDDVSCDDDDVSSNDELASGDEEVLASAPAPSDSPLRTRAAKRRCNDSTPSSDSAPEPACVAKRPCEVPAASPVPASVPAPVPPSAPVSVSTPMDSCSLVSASSPRWIARVPAHVRDLLSAHHSSDTHVGLEDYTSGTIRVAFDFGRLTYRIIKESRSLESDRFHAYLTGVVTPPVVSSFAAPATVLPPLPPDAVPASFPAPG